MMLTHFLMCLFCTFIVVSANFRLCIKLRNPFIKVVTRYSCRYQVSNYQFNLRKLVHPLGYVYPKYTSDVQIVIQCAREYGIKLSIMSGKHSFEKYSYGDDDSWILNLSKLNGIVINKSEGTVAVEAGNLLGNISDYLWNNGKYGIPVGTCLSVGISGFALAGGVGFSTRKYGTLVDNTIGYEIVTAEGKILEVTNSKNRELFWALRGAGSNNFGVVTKFYFKLFDASNIFVLIKKYYTLDKLAAVFGTWHHWTSLNISKSVTSIFGRSATSNEGFYVTFVINDEDDEEAEKQINLIRTRFPNITDKNIDRVSYMDMMLKTSTPYWSIGNYPRFYFRSKGFYVSKSLSEREVNYFASVFRRYHHIGFSMEMHNGAVNERKASETAFVHRSSLYVFKFRFYSLAKGNTSLEEAIRLGKIYEEQVNKVNGELQFMSNGEVYQGYPDNDLDDWCQRYYGENCEGLKSIKRTYDPTNFFRYNQSMSLN